MHKALFSIILFLNLIHLPAHAMWAARLGQALRLVSRTNVAAIRTALRPQTVRAFSTRVQPRLPNSKMPLPTCFPSLATTYSMAFLASAKAAITNPHIVSAQPLATSAQELPEKELSRFFKTRARQVYKNAKNEFVKALAVVFHESEPAAQPLIDLVTNTGKEMALDPRCIIVRTNNAPPATGLNTISTAYSIEQKHTFKKRFKKHIDSIRATTGKDRLYVVCLQSDFAQLPPAAQRFIIGHELMHAHLMHSVFYEHLTESPTDMEQSRRWEREADIVAARKLGCAQDAIDYFSSMLSAQERKELADGIIRKADPKSTHPSLHERIEYLRPMAFVQAKTRVK